MRPLLATVAALLISANASVSVETVPEIIASAYTVALRVVPLGHGDRAIVHPLDDDPSHVAIGATVIQNGRRRDFTAAQWLQSETLPPAMKGQVFTVVSLPDGAMASIAWMDAKHDVHSDVVFLDRTWHSRSHFEIPGGVRDIIAGPNGTVLAVTFDAARETKSHDSPMLVIYSRDGKRLAEGIRVPSGESVQRAITAVQQIRLVEGSGRYYFLDPVNDRAVIFRTPIVGGQPHVEIEQEFPISTLPPATRLVTGRILGASEMLGSLMIVRQGFHLEKPATLFVRYAKDGSVELLAPSIAPWNAAFFEDGVWKGVVESRGVTQIKSADVKPINLLGKAEVKK